MRGRSLSMGGRVPPRPPYNLSTGCNDLTLSCVYESKLQWNVLAH